ETPLSKIGDIVDEDAVDEFDEENQPLQVEEEAFSVHKPIEDEEHPSKLTGSVSASSSPISVQPITSRKRAFTTPYRSDFTRVSKEHRRKIPRSMRFPLNKGFSQSAEELQSVEGRKLLGSKS